MTGPRLDLRVPADLEAFRREFNIAFGTSYLLDVAAAEGDDTLTPERARALAVLALDEDSPQ